MDRDRGRRGGFVVYVRPPNSNWLSHAPIGVPFTADELSDPADRRGAHWTDADVLLVYAPGTSPDEFAAYIARETVKWKAAALAAGFKK